MLVSYKYLSKFVNLDNVSPLQLGDLLTNAGLEVEEVRPFAQGSDLVIGYVKESKKHPESDKLSVNLVDVGSETLQIVCGAPNVSSGQKVIVAMPGCKLDYAKVPEIKKVTLAGVESNGMICSLSELGIQDKFLTKDQLEGIEVLDSNLEIGQEALSTLGLDDYILDISLTPNRSDIYSIYALAIEVAGLTKQKAKDIKMTIDAPTTSEYTIEIKDEACSSYGLFTFENINVGESDQAIKNELMALGLKPRFNVVDYGNLAMITSGNPIHVFDADKLKSKTFTITKGLEKEDFLALDGNTYTITKDDLLIVNGDDIVAIAGVIGSLDSAVDENTKNIVVESANFDHVCVRNTSRRLDIFSDASIRFSKLVNPYTLEFPVALLADFLEVQPSSKNEVNYLSYQPKEIKLTLDRITSVLGIDITLDRCVEILEDLLFEVKIEGNQLSVYPPSYRKDCAIDLDIIEEIIRVYGYDNIQTKLPLQEITYQPLTPLQEVTNNTRDILVSLGLNEIVTYQLNSKDKLDNFSIDKDYLQLAYPLSNEREYFRDQLLSNMVEAISYNKSYQENNLSLFEISNIFKNNVEERYLSIGLMGIFNSTLWKRELVKSDFYVLKGIIFALMEKLGFQYGRFLIKEVEADHPFMHPTKSAYITLNNKEIGIFGEIHPTLASQLKLKNVYVASLDLSVLSNNVGKSNKFEKINTFPAVTRDLSLVIPKEVQANDIVRYIKQSNKLVKDVSIFDVYNGEDLPENTYSLAVSLKIENDKKTLSEEEINDSVNKAISNLQSKLNVSLRS